VGHVPNAKGEGIYIFDVSKKNDGSISLDRRDTIRNITNPSYLSVTRSKKYLYAVSESLLLNESLIHAFQISDNPKNEAYRLIDSYPIGGIGASHTRIDDRDGFVFISNYNGGNVAAFKIDKTNGRLEKRNFHQFTEHSDVNKERQEAPHLHSSVVTSDLKFVYFADLGNDCVYRFDYSEKDGFDSKSLKKFPAPPGSGPRTMALQPGPNQKYLFVSCELSNTVLVYEIDNNRDLKQVSNERSTSPNSPDKGPGVSGLHVSPNSRFVYVATRFVDVITVFEIQSGGKLKFVQEIKTGGEVPRDFNFFSLSRDSQFFLVGNQHTHDITAFGRNPSTGILTKLNTIEVFTPAVLEFVDREVSFSDFSH